MDSKREQAIALTHEVTRKRSPSDTLPSRLLRIRKLLEAGNVEDAKVEALAPHLDRPHSGGRPRACGCVGCRIVHVLNGGTLIPAPRMPDMALCDHPGDGEGNR